MMDADEIRNTLARFSQYLDERRFQEWSETCREHGAFGERVGGETILKRIQGGRAG